MMQPYSDIALLITAIPFALWATWSDLRYMKIPNRLVILMTASFLIIGAIFLPLGVYEWRVIAGIIVLAGGFFLFSIGGIGGGDAKFAAAMTLFVDHRDVGSFLFTLAIFTLLAVFTHWIIGKLKFAAPITKTWDSWAIRRKFPLGYGMGSALIFYLGWHVFT